jgi:hypothetical protein
MNAKYRIESTASTMYINNAKKTVQGFTIYFTLLDYNEFHEVRVPSLDAKVVTAAIQPIVEQRDALAKLTGE